MRSKNQCLRPVSLKKLTGVNASVLRCGKCSACLRQQANELAVRSSRELLGQKVVFLTFTYRNECTPIQHTVLNVDADTGEVLSESKEIIRDTDFYDNAPYSWRLNKYCRKFKRFQPLIVEEQTFTNRFKIDVKYPSIYYEDIKLLFKRFRKRFPNTMGKYICVPEYGSVTYRPHYHFMCFGLEQKHIDSIVVDWSEKFGSVDVKVPDTSNVDQVGKISMYISKYCCKGKFDCPYINNGYCKKPKRAISTNYGLGSDEDWKRLQSYLLAYEIFGEYNPKQISADRFDVSQISLLAKRRSYLMNGYHYPMPKYLIKKIFYNNYKYITKFDYYDKNGSLVPAGTVLYRSCASELQKKISSYILSDLCSDYIRKQEEYQRNWEVNRNDNYIEIYSTVFDEVTANLYDSYFVSELERSSVY